MGRARVFRFTPEAKRHVHPEWVKEKAIAMYREGMSISGISRVLGISLVTVYSWIKKVQWLTKKG